MTKTISLSNRAYEALKEMKLQNDSFSEVVLKLVETNGKLGDILDLYPELIGDKEYEASIAKLRKDIDKRVS